MKLKTVTFATANEAVKAYDAGRCDAYTTDASGLYAERLRLANAERPHHPAGDHLQGAARPGRAPRRRPVVRHREVDALRHGQRRGARHHSKQRRRDDEIDNPDVKRLLGTEGNYGEQLGLTKDWAVPHHQAGRQLRRGVRAQRRAGLAAEDRARPERAVDQRRPAIRAADPLSAWLRRGRGAARHDVRGCRRPLRGRGVNVVDRTTARALRASRSTTTPRSAASSIRSRCARSIAFLIYERGRATRSRICARAHRVRLRLLGQHRRLRHQPDADRILVAGLDLRPRLLGRPAQHAAGRRRSASCSRPFSASSSASRGCRRTGCVAQARHRLRRDHPQHPAAAAIAVLVQRRAQGAAGHARQHCAFPAAPSSTTAACSCRSRCSQPGFDAVVIALVVGRRRRDRVIASGRASGRSAPASRRRCSGSRSA